MEKNKFLNLAKKVLGEIEKPLSSQEIWEIAVAKGYDKELNSQGKTPARTLNAQLHNSQKALNYFVKIGIRPAKFILKEHYKNDISIDQQTKEQVQEDIKRSKELTFKEKDLHPILAYFARFQLNAYLKTIDHRISSKKNYGEWMHPDMVGYYFPFQLWNKEVYDFNSEIGNIPVKIYSFELKKDLNFTNLRESFFQTVSNSSWANEGYLVSGVISAEDDFLNELKRLSSSYGIGIIKLDIGSPDSSEIIYPAKEKALLDWDTVNKIAELNPDFKAFIQRVANDLKTKEVREEEFDKILDIEDLVLT